MDFCQWIIVGWKPNMIAEDNHDNRDDVRVSDLEHSAIQHSFRDSLADYSNIITNTFYVNFFNILTNVCIFTDFIDL